VTLKIRTKAKYLIKGNISPRQKERESDRTPHVRTMEHFNIDKRKLKYDLNEENRKKLRISN